MRRQPVLMLVNSFRPKMSRRPSSGILVMPMVLNVTQYDKRKFKSEVFKIFTKKCQYFQQILLMANSQKFCLNRVILNAGSFIRDQDNSPTQQFAYNLPADMVIHQHAITNNLLADMTIRQHGDSPTLQFVCMNHESFRSKVY